MRPQRSAIALVSAVLVCAVIAVSPAAAAAFDPPQPTAYVVRAGDTLADIAERFSVTPRRLAEANSLSGRLIYPGQVLRIPPSFGPWEQARSGDASQGAPCHPRTTITVRSGDTLSGLARRWDLTVADLKHDNGLTGDRIWEGQALFIACPDSWGDGSRSLPPATAPGTQPADCTGPYIVRPGDNLQRIANRCDVSVASLKAANGLVTNVLMVGQALEVPAALPGSSAVDAGPALPARSATSGSAQDGESATNTEP